MKTIQGEGINAGRPSVFVRTLGCNLDCHYCDTGYRPQDDRSKIPFEKYTMQQLIDEIKDFNVPHICFTGGEPLIHAEFLYEMIVRLFYQRIYKKTLVNNTYPIFNFETNGTVTINQDVEWRRTFSVAYTMDIKPHEYERFKHIYHSNLIHLRRDLGDEVKMVITSAEDLAFADRMINNYNNAEFILSPVTNVETKEFDSDILDLVVEYLTNRSHKNVRIGVQMHKILGVK